MPRMPKKKKRKYTRKVKPAQPALTQKVCEILYDALFTAVAEGKLQAEPAMSAFVFISQLPKEG